MGNLQKEQTDMSFDKAEENGNTEASSRRRKHSAGYQVIVCLLVLNLAFSIGITAYLVHTHGGSGDGTGVPSGYENEAYGKYVLYIGTNDKDTYKQEISLEKAKQIVNEICSRYVEGYTVQEANGGWVDEKGNLTQEETLVYSFNGVQEQDIKPIMDEALEKLNQNSIMVERQGLTYRYYSGDQIEK